MWSSAAFKRIRTKFDKAPPCPSFPSRFRSLRGWARATAVSATLLLLSLGLCGLNAAAFSYFDIHLGGAPDTQIHIQLSNVLATSAIFEAGAILLFAAALVVCCSASRSVPFSASVPGSRVKGHPSKNRAGTATK